MSSYLRPRRGKKATATAQLTASNPLKRGEIFFEVPDTGVGTGKGKLKMGDGSTAYASLPYFMEQPTVDYTNAVVAWTNTTAASSAPYTDNATYANNIVPSASLKTIFTNLKKLLLNYNSQLTSLNNDLDNKQPKGSYASSSHNHDSRYYTESEIDSKIQYKLSTLNTTFVSGYKNIIVNRLKDYTGGYECSLFFDDTDGTNREYHFVSGEISGFNFATSIGIKYENGKYILRVIFVEDRKRKYVDLYCDSCGTLS